MEPQKLNDGTEVTIPLRNLVTIVIAVVLATSAYFSTQSRIQAIEQEMAKTAIVRDMNTEFRIRWPRGELRTASRRPSGHADRGPREKARRG